MSIKRGVNGAFPWTSLGLKCKCGGKYAMYESCFVAMFVAFRTVGPVLRWSVGAVSPFHFLQASWPKMWTYLTKLQLLPKLRMTYTYTFAHVYMCARVCVHARECVYNTLMYKLVIGIGFNTNVAILNDHTYTSHVSLITWQAIHQDKLSTRTAAWFDI
jgi:hypothetical protein